MTVLSSDVFEEADGGTAVLTTVSGGGESRVRILTAFPSDASRWTHRLVGLGSGGKAGTLRGGLASQAARSGDALTCTDMGTSSEFGERDFTSHEILADFGHRATHFMAVVSKDILRRRFGVGPDFAYLWGISTGGQQSLSAVQRHPEDFDGVIAGVPVVNRAALHLYFLWNYKCLHRPDGTALFTKGQERAYNSAAVDILSERECFPHGRGRFIADPRWTTAMREDVLREAARRDPSLTDEHIAALRKMQEGPVADGVRIHAGIPPAVDFAGASGNDWLVKWFFGRDADLAALPFEDAARRLLSAKELNADDPDLSEFRGRGGKIIMYSGSADGCVPYSSALDYHESVKATLGGGVRDFFLYYILPGRAHIGGHGVQFIRDELHLLRSWREKDVFPRAIGHAMTTPSFDIELSPLP